MRTYYISLILLLILICLLLIPINRVTYMAEAQPEFIKTYALKWRKIGVRVKVLQSGFKKISLAGPYTFEVENMGYTIAKVIDAIEIPEDAPIDCPWSKCKKAEDLIGKEIEIWPIKAEPGEYIELRGYLAVFKTTSGQLIEVFFMVKFSPWPLIWADKSTYAVGETIRLFFIAPMRGCTIEIVEKTASYEKTVLKETYSKPGNHTILLKAEEPLGEHVFCITATLSIPPVGVFTSQNCCSVQIVGGADLTITSITVTPSELSEEDTLFIKVKVANIGKYRSSKCTLLVTIGGKELATQEVPPLDPGAEVELNIGGKIPPCVHGEVNLTAIVDSENTVLESNEENNILSYSIKVKGKVPLIEVTTVKPTVFKVNTTAYLTVVVVNKGNGTAYSAEVELKLSKDLKPLVSCSKLDNIAPGASVSATLSFQTSIAKDYNITIIIKYCDSCGNVLVKKIEKIIKVEKISSLIKINAPQRIFLGKEAEIVVEILPRRVAKGLLEIIVPNGTTLQVPFTTNVQGIYKIKLKFKPSGTWIIRASVYESKYYEGSSVETRILVIAGRLPPSILELILALILGHIIGSLHWEKLLGRHIRFFKKYSERERPHYWRIITEIEVLAVVLVVILSSMALAYLESGGLIYDLSILTFILPQVAVACILVTALDQFTESIVSKLEKKWAEYTVWPHGALAFIITGLLLKTPVSGPARTVFEKDYPLSDKAGIAVFKFLAYLAILTLFALFSFTGLYVLYDAGALLSLAFLLYSLIPIKPAPGHALYQQNKVLWIFFFSATGVLYIATVLQYISPLIHLALGAIGLVTLLLIYGLK